MGFFGGLDVLVFLLFLMRIFVVVFQFVLGFWLVSLFSSRNTSMQTKSIIFNLFISEKTMLITFNKNLVKC